MSFTTRRLWKCDILYDIVCNFFIYRSSNFDLVTNLMDVLRLRIKRGRSDTLIIIISIITRWLLRNIVKKILKVLRRL